MLGWKINNGQAGIQAGVWKSTRNTGKGEEKGEEIKVRGKGGRGKEKRKKKKGTGKREGGKGKGRKENGK